VICQGRGGDIYFCVYCHWQLNSGWPHNKIAALGRPSDLPAGLSSLSSLSSV
jgi:hypothetical protein